MKKALFSILLLFILSKSQNSGMYKMRLIDFDNFIQVNAGDLKNKSGDTHPTSFDGEGIEDFVFNVGLSVKTKCNRKAIACIKYKGDNNFYSVSSAENWDPSQRGNEISFVSDITVRLVLPPSESSNKFNSLSKQFQLVIEFTYSEVSEINLIAESTSNLLLAISDKSLNQFVFDHVSLYCDYFKFYIALILIALGLFYIIPSSKLYMYQLLSLQILIIFLIVVIFLCNMIFDFFANLKNQIHNPFLRYFIYVISILIVIYLVYQYAKNCAICEAVTLIDQIDGWRRIVLTLPFFIFGTLLIFITLFYMIYITNFWIGYILGVCMIVGFLLGTCYFIAKLCLISHIFAGSYFLARGISIFLGGFPNENTIALKLQAGLKLPFAFFLYFLGIILIPALAFLYLKNQSTEKEVPKGNPSLVNDSDINIESS